MLHSFNKPVGLKFLQDGVRINLPLEFPSRFSVTNNKPVNSSSLSVSGFNAAALEVADEQLWSLQLLQLG